MKFLQQTLVILTCLIPGQMQASFFNEEITPQTMRTEHIIDLINSMQSGTCLPEADKLMQAIELEKNSPVVKSGILPLETPYEELEMATKSFLDTRNNLLYVFLFVFYIEYFKDKNLTLSHELTKTLQQTLTANLSEEVPLEQIPLFALKKFQKMFEYQRELLIYSWNQLKKIESELVNYQGITKDPINTDYFTQIIHNPIEEALQKLKPQLMEYGPEFVEFIIYNVSVPEIYAAVTKYTEDVTQSIRKKLLETKRANKNNALLVRLCDHAIAQLSSFIPVRKQFTSIALYSAYAHFLANKNTMLFNAFWSDLATQHHLTSIDQFEITYRGHAEQDREAWNNFLTAWEHLTVMLRAYAPDDPLTNPDSAYELQEMENEIKPNNILLRFIIEYNTQYGIVG